MPKTHYVFTKMLNVLVLLALLAIAGPGTAQGQRPLPDEEMVRFMEQRISEPGWFSQSSITIRPESITSPQALQQWRIETATKDENQVYHYSMALDTDNHPHISYYINDKYDLKYVYWDGTSWLTETVDSAGDVGYSNSIALDTAGQPHIAYLDSTNQALKYAYRNDSDWQIQTIDTGTSTGAFTSLVLDAADQPHISYYGDGKIKYAYYDSMWHIQIVDTKGIFGGTSLAIDTEGHPHISYYGESAPGLCQFKYAYWNESSWITQALDSAYSSQTNVSLVLDAADHPHITYHNQNDDLMYAYHDGSTWEIKAIAHLGAYPTPLALDIGGRPHICYTYGGLVWYAYKDGSGWNSQQVDTSGGYGCAMAFNKAGLPHIVYMPNDFYGLKYAVRRTNVGYWSNLAFASYRDDNFEVYTAQGNGTSPIRRTNNSATDSMPEFNWGTNRIAFVSNRDNNTEIYAMNADGSGQTRLTATEGSETMPTWSSDGTKIAFYSNRDGNYEIYVMNADGSAQTRLTSDAAWDGHPTWSPDGAKIAFASNRSGSYQLWTMNADGSNQQPLTTGLVYAAYPDWSPDGSRIAFNNDSNNDGWLDVAVINADGTSLVYPLGNSLSFYDYLAPAWAPNGTDLAFAQIHWVNYQGKWYWHDAYLYVVDVSNSSTYMLTDYPGSGYDWWPDWQSTDLAAPSSQVAPLPIGSPPTFTVRWSGTDSGAAGMRSYDVQYHDGPGGAWTDWLLDTTQTSATFSGIYGHTYYFRSRARDFAGNLEPYPTGDGDAHTIVFRYQSTGQVINTRHQPIFNATVSAQPAMLNIAQTDGRGDYALYLNITGTYTLTASRAGFGALPPRYGITVTHSISGLDFVLPPQEQAIVNGGWESGDMTGWHSSLGITPTVEITAAHTGHYGLRLELSGTMTIPQPCLAQTVLIPGDWSQPTLSWLYHVAQASAGDALLVEIVGSSATLTYTIPMTPSGAWMHAWYDLSALAGQTTTVRFGFQSLTGTQQIYLDEISLGQSKIGVFPVYLPIIALNH